MMEISKLKEWLETACKSICNYGDCQDAHIDEFITFEPNNKEQLFQEVIALAKYIQTNLLDIVKVDCRLFLYVALDSNTNSILGVPRNYSTLIERIDTSYPPELVLYKELEKGEFNKVELYKSCLPFETYCGDSIEIVYRELRSFDELMDDEEYNRELHLIIK